MKNAQAFVENWSKVWHGPYTPTLMTMVQFAPQQDWTSSAAREALVIRFSFSHFIVLTSNLSIR